MARYFHGKRVSKEHYCMLKEYEHRKESLVLINSGQRTMADQWRQVREKGVYNARTNPHGAAYPTPSAPHIKWGLCHHALDGNAPEPIHGIASFYRHQGVPVDFNVVTEAWHMDTLDRGKLKKVARRFNYWLKPTLKPYTKGKHIEEMKRLLVKRGFRQGIDPGSNYYGKAAAAQVKAFQRKRHLKADGVVGPMTWKALQGK